MRHGYFVPFIKVGLIAVSIRSGWSVIFNWFHRNNNSANDGERKKNHFRARANRIGNVQVYGIQ